MKDADFPQRFEARLHVGFAAAPTSETYVEDVFGGARRPPSREAVLTKFRANAGVIGSGRGRATRSSHSAVRSRSDRPRESRALRRFQSVAVAHAAE